MRSKGIKQFESDYQQIKPDLDKLREALKTQVLELLRKERVPLGFPIQHRTKNWSSIIDKVEGGRYTVKKSIKEMQDLVGLRIVLLFNRDVDVVCSLIKNNVTVIKRYDTTDKLKDDQFGYSSKHFVVKIPQEWTKLPTFNGLDEYFAEIQVRTLSQHTWAEASRQLQYKQEDSVPRPLLRSIGRVSALLETVDLEFERLLKQREGYIKKLNKDIKSDKNFKLNVDTLKAILDKKLPAKNKDEFEEYSELIEELKFFNIYERDGLISLIDNHLEEVIDEDEKIVEKILNKLTGIYSDDESYEINDDRIIKGVFYTHVGLVRSMLKIKYPEKWLDYFI